MLWGPGAVCVCTICMIAHAQAHNTLTHAGSLCLFFANKHTHKPVSWSLNKDYWRQWSRSRQWLLNSHRLFWEERGSAWHCWLWGCWNSFQCRIKVITKIDSMLSATVKLNLYEWIVEHNKGRKSSNTIYSIKSLCFPKHQFWENHWDLEYHPLHFMHNKVGLHHAR